ncbi:glycosyltransferase family 1 protein, partial [Escherichia coli]|nr:glycosyltransferase family 1 protein [Escherichia coli]
PRHRDPRYRAALLAECGLDPSATLLLGIGRHAPEKRWGMVIDAVLSAATQHPIALLLVGEGRLQGRLIARAGGSPHIRIPG